MTFNECETFQIEERIFRHLMRQTDEGIAYEESGLVMTNGYGSSDDEDDDDENRMNGDDADGDILEQGGYPWSLAVFLF